MTPTTGIADSRSAAPRSVHAVAWVAAAWCLGFAGVNLVDLVAGPDLSEQFGDDVAGIAAMSALVLAIKVVGALVALASVRPPRDRTARVIVAVGLWAAFGLLALYSAGNLAITAVTVGGLVEPSAAWEAAGGVSVSAVLYVLFFLVGAAIFGVLAVSYHRRHDPGRAVAATGLVGAPVLLATLLGVLPWALGALGWLS